jgi:hypothetical protein
MLQGHLKYFTAFWYIFPRFCIWQPYKLLLHLGAISAEVDQIWRFIAPWTIFYIEKNPDLSGSNFVSFLKKRRSR